MHYWAKSLLHEQSVCMWDKLFKLFASNGVLPRKGISFHVDGFWPTLNLVNIILILEGGEQWLHNSGLALSVLEYADEWCICTHRLCREMGLIFFPHLCQKSMKLFWSLASDSWNMYAECLSIACDMHCNWTLIVEHPLVDPDCVPNFRLVVTWSKVTN